MTTDKYYVHRNSNGVDEMIFSSMYFDDCLDFIQDEIIVNKNRFLEDYYILNDNNKIISVENDGWV